jgi:hypothetical protein
MAGDVVRGARERHLAYNLSPSATCCTAGAERSPVGVAGSVAFRMVSRDKRQGSDNQK